MVDPWTVRRVLAWTAADFERRGIDSPRLDADLLVAHALGLERISLYLDLDRPLDEAERAAVRQLVERRRRREPVAYILGEREFYGRPFEVTKDVLIPRPDTELLVERALALLRGAPEGPVLDLCTGSGAVAVCLAAECPARRVTGTDISAAALAVARRNAQRNAVPEERLRLLEGDLFDAVPAGERFVCITANPPYVREAERATLAPDVAQFEPGQALFAGADGLDVIRRIAAAAPERLLPGGWLLLEVGHDQAPQVAALLERAGLTGVVRHVDLAGVERVIEARLPA